jgi:hypothetical protein
MAAREKIDLLSGIFFLLLSLIIVNFIVPDFGSSINYFMTNQFAFLAILFILAFIVAVLHRKCLNKLS